MIPFIAAAFSAVTSVVSSLGPTVVVFCQNVLPKILPILEKGMETLQIVEKIANTVAQVIGIFNHDETVEDIGDRAIQAADQGIKPDRFSTHTEYMDALREWKLDPERTAALTSIQKIVSGLAVAARGLDEKFDAPEGTMGHLWVLAAAQPRYFDTNKLTQFLQTGQDIPNILHYFEGRLNTGASLRMEEKLVELDQVAHPDQDEKSIRSHIYAAAEAVQNQTK